MPRDRKFVGKVADMVMDNIAVGFRPGIMIVLTVHEKPEAHGELEVDASIRAGDCYSELGDKMLSQFADDIRRAIDTVCDKIGDSVEVAVPSTKAAPS